MRNQFWLDESGVVLSTELILLMTMLVIGLVTGMTALKTAVDVKLADVGGAIGALDSSFGFTGTTFTPQTVTSTADSTAFTNGTEFLSDAASNADTDRFGVGGLTVLSPLTGSETVNTVVAP